jgi:cytochrome c-type biogenesis protein CcmH
MSDAERMEMIRGMVEGLSDRLATEGGPPEDWARLIGALGVLGNAEQAAAIADEAEQVFAGNDAALSLIAEARMRAGLN